MKEKRDIINSYDLLLQNGKRSALATVVHVEGSSYRRPGARMLISEDGHLTGAISGGCLEGDAMRKALLVINAQVPALVTYDTMDEDDAIIGIGLGCNGIIQILIEPIDPKYHINPVEIIKSIYQKRQNTVMATFFSWKDKKRIDVGTMFFIDQDGNIHGYLPQLFDSESIQSHAAEVIQNKQNVWIDVARDGEEMTAFLEFIPPPMTLVIAGAGNDVIPLADMADILGWKTIIVDGRANYARKDRFSKSCDVLLAKPDEVLKSVEMDDYTFFALMTHNYNYDKALIHELCVHGARYIAMLGPKKKLERMLSEFEDEGRPVTEDAKLTIYSPAGLDIGAETSEEIALSIASEMKSVMSNKSNYHLRNKQETIHA